ncbi:hypothetical protein [Candidatus Nanohalococcus occultus]|uniref:hypothetical protein n=1 Tax=Candidatus Nanohalococcus occultus TaxID=2978047 RepID=UPI0039E02FD1
MKKILALSLLALTVIASGCIDSGTDEPTGAIHVDYLNFRPDTREIYTGGTVGVNMKVSNIGEAPAELEIGEKGSKILTNYCPYLFDLGSFQKTGSTALGSGEDIVLNWELEQSGEVLNIGSECQVEFRLPFQYSASVYRQIQLRSSSDVSASRNLGYESSSGPLKFVVATMSPSGQSPVFTMPEDGRSKTVTLLMQMRNRRSGQGSIDIKEESLQIKAPEFGIDEGFETVTSTEVVEGACGSGSGSSMITRQQAFCVTNERAVKWSSNIADETKCNIDELEAFRLTDSNSRTIRCNVELPQDLSEDVSIGTSSSIVSELQASVNYTYTRDMPSRTVRVNPRG